MVAFIGVLAGAAGGLNALAREYLVEPPTPSAIARYAAGGAAIGAAVLLAARLITLRLAGAVVVDRAARGRFIRLDVLTYIPAMATFLGAWGVLVTGPVVSLSVLVAITAKLWLLYAALSAGQREAAMRSAGYLATLFLVSGFAALIYQIVWQRALFAAFGVNIESITVIVSLFMFGLGVGAVVGGLLSRRYPGKVPLLFLVCEVLTGLFGIVSVPLIAAVSALTLDAPLPAMALAIFGLLFVPTGLMGATLPMLATHLFRHYRNVGKSVGLLYCINTLGSAAACFITADVLFVVAGQQAAVLTAAGCNIAVGVLTGRYAARLAAAASAGASAAPTGQVAAELAASCVGARGADA